MHESFPLTFFYILTFALTFTSAFLHPQIQSTARDIPRITIETSIMRGKKKKSNSKSKKSTKKMSSSSLALVPSQVVSSLTQQLSESQLDYSKNNVEYDSGGDDIVCTTQAIVTETSSKKTIPTNKINMKKSNHSSSESSSISSNSDSSTSNNSTKRKWNRLRQTGNIPDIHWRTIPMSHLRQHPLYDPLPHPHDIKTLPNLEYVSQFRQDSWQWDALHSGRCTTSQVAPALGFLEPSAATVLGIPKSLRKNCMSAFYRLGKDGLRSLEEMERVLCQHDDYDGVTNNNDNNSNESNKRETEKIWSRKQSPSYPFAAKYLPTIRKHQFQKHQKDAKKFMSTLDTSTSRSVISLRMNWGNSQEPVAILTALNYFAKHSPGMVLKEVGMCGAGLQVNTTAGEDGLLVGASPDSVIQHANGTLEVLEVKNHCPFIKAPNKGHPIQTKKKKSSSNHHHHQQQQHGTYRIRVLPLEASVPPAYIPQLMMEMMCLGPKCKSAVMVRQTATNGAIILRLHRNDEWINEMMYWLHIFMEEYVRPGNIPPPDFFYDDDERKERSDRYKKFLDLTKELSEGVEYVDCVSHQSIQRVLSDKGIPLPLFLD